MTDIQVSTTPPDAPELSVRAINMVLLHFESHYGLARLESLWQRKEIPLPISYVRDLNNFVSLRFTEQLTQILLEDSGDPNFVREAARQMVSPKALGFAYYMLKAFGSPRLLYPRLVGMAAAYNRVGIATIESLQADSLELTYQSKIPEANHLLCEGRQAQYAVFPTLWGLPVAEVEELHCQQQGAPCCRYHVRWKNPEILWRKHAGLGGGLALGLILHILGVNPLVASMFLCGVGGFGIGGWLDARILVSKKNSQLDAQTEGLIQSLLDLRVRHEEIQRAKEQVEATNRDLEKRVQERTSELEFRSAELSQTNQQLAVALKQQKELDKAKTQFFDNVSHELRTPLTLIILSTERLLQVGAEASDAEKLQHLTNINRSGTKLVKLINNLLDLAKAEAGEVRLRYEPVELTRLLKSSLAPFHALAQQKQVWLLIEGPAVTPVHVDVEMIEGAIHNLVSNALKFTAEGGVTVRLSEDEKQVTVEVVDTGGGMAKEDLPRIFDRFAQADSSGIRKLGGTGIGLALVKENVHLHKGTIIVDSEVNVGTTFRISLPKGTEHIQEGLRERRTMNVPVRRPRRAMDADPLQAFRPTAKAASEPNPADGLSADVVSMGPDDRMRRILLVEDDELMRGAVINILKHRYRVIEATDGEDGLKKAISEKPELVITDYMMPAMSGLQLTRAIRDNAQTTDIPVILLTARREADAAVEGLTAGANDYIGKPFSPRELLARIETQLRLRDVAARAAENERLATLGHLTSGFVQEVRVPLANILGALSAVLPVVTQGGDAARARGPLEKLGQATEELKLLADNLLSVYPEHGQQGPVSICSAIDSVLQVMHHRMPAGVLVERDYKCQGNVVGNPSTLNQVWSNLIDNALRALGASGKLRISTDLSNNHDIRVTISDNGAGIPAGDLEKVFQPFFSTRPEGQGTGLGLSTSRRVVVQHHGRIELKSEPGKGTHVTVRLPLDEASLAAIRNAPSDPRTLQVAS